jgi:hypothetical protein
VLAGKVAILAATSLNQGNLIRPDDNHGTVFRRVQDDSLDDRRLQR